MEPFPLHIIVIVTDKLRLCSIFTFTFTKLMYPFREKKKVYYIRPGLYLFTCYFI